MASDWIKMRTDLYRDPKVCVMADLLMDRDSALARYVNQNMQCDMSVTRNVMRNVTVGALVSVWGVLRHRGKRINDDLVIRGCNVSVVDDIAEIPGFGLAMLEVSWIEESDEGIVFPRFFEEFNVDPEEENKKKNAERQRRYREKQKEESNANSNVTVASQNNAREEKRREVNTSSVPDGFDLFWDAYGKKTGKVNAVREWKKISPSGDLTEKIVSAAAVVAKTIEPKYRKDPERWLRDRRWEDELSSETVSDGMPGVIL